VLRSPGDERNASEFGANMAGSPESKGDYDEESGGFHSPDQDTRVPQEALDDGTSTPATVSIDSLPPSELGDGDIDSSSDEGDEEDEGLIEPLASTMTSIPNQITRSFSGDGTGVGGAKDYVESLFGRSP